ncbi:MAG TPA: TonB-dependent receptor plug domain-containing protein [Croceibacterium sp.]
MRGLLITGVALAALALPGTALAQETTATESPEVVTGDVPPPIPTDTPVTDEQLDAERDPEARTAPASGAQVYTPADFARFAPRSALDMLGQVPGFTIISNDQGRGLGQASDNVIINGERVASKSESLFDVLQRIPAARVVRIEIVDGATLGIPGLSGQVANVITSGGAISGRYEWRGRWRPKYAKPSYVGGEVSVSGSTPTLEWNLAATLNVGRGGAGGNRGTTIYDGAGNVTATYPDVLIQFVGDFPRLAGSLKWDGPGSTVAHFNANYSRTYSESSFEEDRDLVNAVDLFRDVDNRTRGYAYEIGGDVDFALGPGRLKLIGLDRYNQSDFRSDAIMDYEDASPSTGSRFAQQSDSGEIIARAEYSWNMLGGTWQLDAEGAFNRLDQTAQLYLLDTGGDFDEIPFPSGSGGVTEDRYEMILNHNRTLGAGLTLQVSAGGEYSKLAQTGANGLIREFWRPKGSATLAWTPEQGLDLSLKFARVIGQLSFADFLASVNLGGGNASAGNNQLVPPQSWELDLDIKKGLGAWGSANLKLYGRWIEDYIEFIPVGAGLESRGNIDSARNYGVSLTSTINLDPLGWAGAKIDANARYEDSSLEDPLTGEKRSYSGHNYFNGEISLRYDVPKSNWAVGGGFNWTQVQPYVRLSEVGKDYEGPIYTFAFVENKDVLGLTVSFNMFNLTGGRSLFDRTVWNGYRDRNPISFIESRRLDISTIYSLTIKGSF